MTAVGKAAVPPSLARHARTLVQLDNPAALTAEIRRFVKEHPLPGEG
ncbi:hypothetical protein [Streptomyces sp. Ag109_G2-15]|nr:hypothetical protein [Streptomyces sp. Ag109_G2-15]SOE06899.1 hypothetical protein SAMN06272765_7771 [Streptomyces sp. Ag109_G2-15]